MDEIKFCMGKQISTFCNALYEDIIGISASKGYCEASNKKLANQYKVDRRTIQRWIKVLKTTKQIDVYITDNNNRQLIPIINKQYKEGEGNVNTN